MKKTDLEKLKGLKLANDLKRGQQARAGKTAQTASGKPAQRSNLLKALLGAPVPQSDEPVPKK